jgi:DNA invertase Pin-like site-specific DNA recombinase
MDVGVDYAAVDNPHANKLTIHVLAAVAEHEREAISERTKAALAATKGAREATGTPDLAGGSEAKRGQASGAILGSRQQFRSQINGRSRITRCSGRVEPAADGFDAKK